MQDVAKYISLVIVQNMQTDGVRMPVPYDRLITGGLPISIDGVSSVVLTMPDQDENRELIRAIARAILTGQSSGLLITANDKPVYGISAKEDDHGMISHGTLQVMETTAHPNESRYRDAKYVTLSDFLGNDDDVRNN